MIYRHRVVSFFVCSFFATFTFFLASASTSQSLKRALAIRRHATHSVFQKYASQLQAESNPTFGRFNEQYHVHYHQRTKTHEELKFNWNAHYEQELVSGLKQTIDYFQLQKQSVNYYNSNPIVQNDCNIIAFYEDKVRYAEITPQHQLDFSQKKVADWQNMCSQAEQSPTLYSLYQFDSYREFVKNQPNYQAEMAKIHVTLRKDDNFFRWLKTVPNNAYDYIAKEAHRAFVVVETETLRKINNDTHLPTKSSIDRIKNQLNEQEKNLTTVVANPTIVDYVAKTCRQEHSIIQALKPVLDTVSSELTNDSIEYRDYSKSLTSDQWHVLRSLGITTHDFEAIGTTSQHSMRSKLFVEHGLVKIADILLLPGTHGINSLAIQSALQSAVHKARQGSLCIRNNDISGTMKHFTAMTDLVVYAQEIKSGELQYKEIYDASQFKSLIQQYTDYRNTVFQREMDEKKAIVTSCELLHCSKDCTQKHYHQDLRDHNFESLKCNFAIDALCQLSSSDHTIVVKQYELSSAMQDLLRNAGIPISVYQKCTGNFYAQAVQAQMLDLLKKSAHLSSISGKDSAAQDLLNVSYAGIFAARHGEHNKALLAMRLGHNVYRHAINPQFGSPGHWAYISDYEKCRQFVADFKRMMTENAQSLSNSNTNLTEDLLELEKLSFVLADLTKADSPNIPINIEEQTKHVSENAEKVDVLWEYLMKNNRVILGIQPMPYGYRVEQGIDILLSNALGKVAGHCVTLTKNYLTSGIQVLRKSETFARAVSKCTTALEKLEGFFAKNIPNLRVADTNIKAPASLKQVGEKIGGAGEVVAKGIIKAGQFSVETIEEAVRLVMNDSNKIKHIFDKPRHGLDQLIKKYGSQEATIQAVLTEANNKFKFPSSGVFTDIPVDIVGVTVYIRGNIINDIPRLGTMFIK